MIYWDGAGFLDLESFISEEMRAYNQLKDNGVIILSEFKENRRKIYGDIPPIPIGKIDDLKDYKNKLLKKSKEKAIKESNNRILRAMGKKPDQTIS